MEQSLGCPTKGLLHYNTPAPYTNVELCDLHISLYQEYRSPMDTVDDDASGTTLSACYFHHKVQSTYCQQVSLQTFVSTEWLEDWSQSMLEGQNVTACGICEKDFFLWPQYKYSLGKWSKGSYRELAI